MTWLGFGLGFGLGLGVRVSTEGLPHPPAFERRDVAHPEGEVLVDEVAEESRAHHALRQG